MSSTRRMKTPSLCRAHNQEKRALTGRCRRGASRTAPARTGSGRSRPHHRIAERPDAVDLDLDDVAAGERGRRPRACPSAATSPGKQRHEGGDVLDQLGDPEDHVRGEPRWTTSPFNRVSTTASVGSTASRSTDRAGTTRRSPSPASIGRRPLQVSQRHVVRAREPRMYREASSARTFLASRPITTASSPS